jgi:hypothetical protein
MPREVRQQNIDHIFVERDMLGGDKDRLSCLMLNSTEEASNDA